MNIDTSDLRILGLAQIKAASEALKDTVKRSKEFESKIPTPEIRSVIAVKKRAIRALWLVNEIHADQRIGFGSNAHLRLPAGAGVRLRSAAHPSCGFMKLS